MAIAANNKNSELTGCSLAIEFMARGKSGLLRTGWSVTPTDREIRESATESIPPNDCGVSRDAWQG